MTVLGVASASLSEMYVVGVWHLAGVTEPCDCLMLSLTLLPVS